MGELVGELEGETLVPGEEDFLGDGFGVKVSVGDGGGVGLGETLIKGVVSFVTLALIESMLSQIKHQTTNRPIKTPDFIRIERFILLFQLYHIRIGLARYQNRALVLDY